MPLSTALELLGVVLVATALTFVHIALGVGALGTFAIVAANVMAGGDS